MISVIIPAYNEEVALPKTLQHLLALPGSYEVLVVDGRSDEGLALLDVTSRISETLLQLAAEQGTGTADGVAIESRPTHQELANMSGTTRETVSRVLKRLEGQGYIICSGRRITILREEKWKD